MTAGLARVCAIDEASGTEAVAVGPASTPGSDLEALALRKLERLLAAASPAPAAPPRRGKLV